MQSIDDLNALDANTESIIMENDSCNDYDFTELDLSRFTNLTSLIIGDRCFGSVTTMNITGMQHLETITIGMDSFSSYGESDYSFSVTNCSSLKELKIGPSSFSEWNYIEIGDVPSLEVLEIGYLHYNGGAFYWGTQFELKGNGDGMK